MRMIFEREDDAGRTVKDLRMSHGKFQLPDKGKMIQNLCLYQVLKMPP